MAIIKRIQPRDDKNEMILSVVKDAKSKKEFKVVRLDKDHIALVIGTEDIIKIPIWYFFMVTRGVRDAENKLLKS